MGPIYLYFIVTYWHWREYYRFSFLFFIIMQRLFDLDALSCIFLEGSNLVTSLFLGRRWLERVELELDRGKVLKN